jgi:hypothetical protein
MVTAATAEQGNLVFVTPPYDELQRLRGRK